MEISLALGGGGIKGVAHIGVIAALEDAGVRIQAIAGTSAGGMVGAMYAVGIKPAEMAGLLEQLVPQKMFARQHNDGPSLMGLAGISQILSSRLGKLTFHDTRIPFACTAVDIHSSQEIIINQGPLIDAVLATVAVPGVFPPRQQGNYLFVDGAILDPVPVAVARWLAPNLPVCASVLSPPPENWADLPPFHLPHTSPLQERVLEQVSRLRFGQALNMFIQSMDITSRMLTELRLEVERPEVIIRPRVEHYSMLQDVLPQELIDLGRQAAESILPDLRNSYRWQGRLSRRLRRVEPPEKLLDEAQ